MAGTAPVFGGSIAGNYRDYLVPLFFDDYASKLARRVEVPNGGAVLELACGTGAVTKHLRTKLPSSVHLVATDINPGMLETAKGAIGDHDGIEFQVADGTDLPFEDGMFDAVVCQFGVMFFPDKARAYAEAARVLRPGGRLHFNVWDALHHNALSKLVHEVVSELSPDNPITFMAMPFNYCDVNAIKDALEAAGFRGMEILVQPGVSRAKSAQAVVTGMLAGSPLAAQLEERGLVEKGSSAVEAALKAAHGDGAIAAPMQAIVFSASKRQ